MKLSDKELGMDRSISRRDFLNGAAAVTAAGTLPGGALADSIDAADANYPPGRTGLRGSHPGSFEAAHELAWQGREDWGRVRDAESVVYDLVVVGAGISGLAAAHLFRQQNSDARILILDNHDDFGGHAKRNEFQFDDQRIIGYGGTMLLEAPGSYPDVARKLIKDLGIETEHMGISDLGTAKKISISSEDTTLIEGGGTKKDIEAREKEIRKELDVTTTDHRGVARMNLIGAGRITVTQVAPWYPYTSPVLEPVSRELNVALQGGELSIAGRVIDSDGREAQAVVAVQPEATRQFVGRIMAVPSGFRIEGLRSGRYRVVVRLRQGIAKGQVPSVAPVVEAGDTDVARAQNSAIRDGLDATYLM